jgi:hypothetical protein
MHKLTSYTLDDSFFEYPVGEAELLKLNFLIQKYKNSKDIHDFYKLKNELLEGFLQKRTINTSYMTLLSMRQQRKNHKLEQWHNIIDMIENLPYFTELTGIYENTERE